MSLNLKYFFDYLLGIILLLLFSPVIIVIYISGLLFIGRPVFFTQLRPGLNGKPFLLFKFRSMKLQKDSTENDDMRLTRYGKFLRSTSLDELPQLINVIKGELSLVGPRPLLLEYLPLYNERQSKRHQMKPGITGWAQVNGRNSISWDQKLEFDVWYIENWSMWLDVKILFLTLFKVFKRLDVNSSDGKIMEKFTGKSKN